MEDYNVKENFSLFWGGPYSQWYKVDIKFCGITFNCNEQFMMFFKALACGDIESSKLVMATPNPKLQKVVGRKVNNFSEEKWSRKVSMAVVYAASYCKFTQNADLFNYLIGDPGFEIVEASPYDVIWGIGLGEEDPLCLDKTKWKGENCLGLCIDQVRAYLSDPGMHHEYHNACFMIVDDLLSKIN